MKLQIIALVFLFVSVNASAQGTYTFSKNLTYTAIGDWVQFGKLDGPGTGSYAKVRAWCHYSNQLFIAEFDVPTAVYGNPTIEWVEVAPKLSAAWNGIQNFALDVRYKCSSSCAVEFRLRRLSGGYYVGDIYFSVDASTAFTEQNIQGSSGAVEPGFLGSSAGYKFAVANSTFSNSTQGLFIQPNGNVGIGTTSPAEKLSVNGKIRAKEMKVETANWPDYVFSKEHSLRSLGDLEKYIQTNRHLPEIPSAEEVGKDGIELGEMNAKLLKKIEELTLYMIGQDKRIDALEKQLQKK